MCSTGAATLLQQPDGTAHIWSNNLGGAAQGCGGFVPSLLDNRKIP